MDLTDTELPPAKKRRFFTEPSDLSDLSATKKSTVLNALPQCPPTTATTEPSSDDLPPSSSLGGQTTVNIRLDEISRNGGAFDKELFESIVGQRVAPAAMQRLREISGENLERALNMFYDGSWQNDPSDQASTPRLPLAFGSLVVDSPSHGPSPIETKDSVSDPKSGESPRPRPAVRLSMPESRYVGAFGVGAWATRSGTNLLRHGESVRVERQKIQPPSTIPKRGGKSKTGNVQPARPSSFNRRTDIIVRFTNVRGDEIGRLPKDTAAWVSTLLDQNMCRFEGTCVFVPDGVRINDTIYLQLRCSLLLRAFEPGGFKTAETNRTTGIFEVKETEEEKDLRLRQIALVKLFEEINLHPTKTSATTEQHKRQGLLQAAEVAEQYDAKNTDAAEDKSSSPPSEDVEEGKELEQDQLDTLYKKAQSFDFNTPAAEPAPTFVMSLRQYQKQALHWMVSKEKDEKTGNEQSMHPLWEEYSWPTKDYDDKHLPVVTDQTTFYVNPYSGELSLDFPVQEQHCLGGILADEMGLGKTIEMLSLMHTHKSAIALESASSGLGSVNRLPRLPKNSSAVESAPCTTLVVAPMSLLAQWQSEAEKASTVGTMKTIVYYGNDKSANLQTLCCEANAASAPQLVITSYGVVLSEFNQVAAAGGSRGSHGGLFSLDFFRVILDEAHHVKNRQSKTAKACYEISAQHRWVLTGTPIVNRLEDLFSLVHFLRVEPWSNFSFWKTFITVPFESKDFISALDVVQTVLEPLVLRRTKDMKTPDGESLVPLPPKTIEIDEIELSKPEREVYDHIFTRAKRTFAANIEAGTLLKSYTTIFAQILRLRQSCCHPVLTRNKTIAAEEEEAAAAADIANGLADDMDLQSLIERFTADEAETDANRFGAHVLKQIQAEAGHECPICAEEPMVEQSVTGCWHSACKKCLLDYIDHQKAKDQLPRCFNCREPINARDVFEVVKHDDEEDPYAAESSAPRISLRRVNAHNSSAKIEHLTMLLKRVRSEDPSMKSVVFSQFTSFLDLIEPALERANIPFLRFDGSMAQKARAAVLIAFAEHARGAVLLLSLRAGGVGLNLTSAKRVFLMDPWWSFAVEAQAIDRVHRMGQDAAVAVHRFIVRDSVEHRMLKIQDRKKFM